MEIEGSKGFDRYKNAHHFYRDVVSSDYALPNELLKNLQANPEVFQKFIQILNSNHQAAKELINSTNFSLENKNEIALKSLLEAISLTPKKPDSIYGSEEYNEFRKKLSILENLKEKCLKNETAAAEYYYNFALIYIKAGLVEEAVALLEKSLEINPDFSKASVPLAVIYNFAEDWDNAYKHADSAISNGLEVPRGALLQLSLFTSAFKKNITSKSIIRLNSQNKNYKFSLSDALDYFPKIEGDIKYKDYDGTVFCLPSDSIYFKQHSIAFACSIDTTNPGNAVHFHITNIDAEDQKIIENLKNKLTKTRIFVTTEELNYQDFMDKGLYLSATRDVKLYQLLLNNSNRYIRFDVDGLMNKNIKNSVICDTSFVTAAQDKMPAPFWEFILNGLKSVQKSEFSMKILEELAMLIFDNFYHKTHLWFSDQVYINFLYEKYKNNPEFKLVETSKYLDLLHDNNSYTWMVTLDKSGFKKYSDKKLEYLKKYGLEEYFI